MEYAISYWQLCGRADGLDGEIGTLACTALHRTARSGSVDHTETVC